MLLIDNLKTLLYKLFCIISVFKKNRLAEHLTKQNPANPFQRLLDFDISICFLLGSLITLASHVSVHDVLATLALQSLL